MHHLIDMLSLRSFPRARTLRAAVAWGLVVAFAGSLPASANARYVCSMGMAQAGPDCPRCHGDQHQRAIPPSKAPCCNVVISAAPSATSPASITVPAPSPVTLAVLPPKQHPSADLRSAAAVAESPPHHQTSLTSSIILRL